MVKKIFLFGLLLLTVSGTNAQVGLYRSTLVAQNEESENSINHYDKSVLFLSLLEEREYNLVLSLSSGDCHSDIQLSFGSYTKTGNVLLLNDDLFGFVMQMEFENDNCLKSVNGLSIIKGKNFVFSGTKTIPTYRFGNAKSFLFEDQRVTSDVTKTVLDFPSGKYRNGAMGRYELDLSCHGRYQYNIDGFLISKGKWRREGQSLLFYDDEMPLPFFAPIDKEGKNVFLIIGNPRFVPLSILEVSCQNGFYTLQCDDFAVSLQLHDGTYFLVFDSSGDDFVYYDKISYGGYVVDSGFLTLHDSLLGYEMRMRIVSSTELMFLRKGYRGVRYTNISWSKPSKYARKMTELDVERIKTICEEYRNQDALNPFPHGQYLYSNIQHFFELSLFDSGLFQYKIYDIPMLEGSFERYGNLLLLHDNEIKEPFCILIEKDGIIPFLPGIFGLRRLKTHVENGELGGDSPEN